MIQQKKQLILGFCYFIFLTRNNSSFKKISKLKSTKNIRLNMKMSNFFLTLNRENSILASSFETIEQYRYAWI